MKSKIHFITIGYVEWRKGQDLLVDAIEMLPDNARVNSEFLFIGQNSSLLAQKISDRISNIPCVHMQGTVPL
jgi:glycosyltransferase involved in cell wall biosynthesis